MVVFKLNKFNWVNYILRLMLELNVYGIILYFVVEIYCLNIIYKKKKRDWSHENLGDQNEFFAK